MKSVNTKIHHIFEEDKFFGKYLAKIGKYVTIYIAKETQISYNEGEKNCKNMDLI